MNLLNRSDRQVDRRVNSFGPAREELARPPSPVGRAIGATITLFSAH